MNAWLVNTNAREESHNPNGFIYMLHQNKVAAYADRRHQVDVIKPSDLVLLYHNANRVIAVGFALKATSHDYKELSDVEHWVDVNWLWKADFNEKNKPTNPINRNDIGIEFVNKTVVNISGQLNHKKLLEEIGKRQKYQ